MTLFKKTIFSLKILSLGLVLANSAHAMTSNIAPIYNPNANLSVWVGADHGMEGASENAYLYSDGSACYLVGAVGGVVLLKGKWQYNKDKTSIDIQVKTKSNGDFRLIVYDYIYNDEKDTVTTQPNKLLLSELSFYNKKPIYLGFSNQETPTQMVMFDYSKHQPSIKIPPNSRYLFVAQNMTSNQNNQVARFNLNRLGYDNHNIELVNNDGLMGVSEDDINMNFGEDLKIAIENGKFGLKYSHSNHVKFFDEVASFDVNTYVNDDFNLKRLHGYCSGRSDDFYLDIISNKQSNLTKPTYINWHGNISPNADWLKNHD